MFALLASVANYLASTRNPILLPEYKWRKSTPDSNLKSLLMTLPRRYESIVFPIESTLLSSVKPEKYSSFSSYRFFHFFDFILKRYTRNIVTTIIFRIFYTYIFLAYYVHFLISHKRIKTCSNYIIFNSNCFYFNRNR